MKSTQVSNHDELPYRNSTIDEFGRVRILSFTCKPENKVDTNEEIILAKLPSGIVKILSISLQYNNLGESTLNYTLSQSNRFDPIFEVGINLKSVSLVSESAEIETIINTTVDSQYGVYINAILELDLPESSTFEGYILYVVD